MMSAKTLFTSLPARSGIPTCLHSLHHRSQSIRSQIYGHATRKFSQTVSQPVKTKISNTKKCLTSVGLLSLAAGGTYLCLHEPQKRKVRVTMGGFVRFFR